MAKQDLGWKVGAFVLTGFVVAAALILHFGKFGDRFRGDYDLVVRFENASGLIPGSQVLYAGVQVGKVEEIRLDPQGRYVDVVLTMFRFKRAKYSIKKDATFMVKRSGLLGDVVITINPGSPAAPEAQPGEILHGKAPTGLSEMAESAEELLQKLNDSVDRLTTELLDDATLSDLRLSVQNFRDLTLNLNENSSKLNRILGRVGEGRGTVGKLLNDEEIFENFKALSYNLRKGGVLFYKDRYDEDQGKTDAEKKAEQKQKERMQQPPKSRR